MSERHFEIKPENDEAQAQSVLEKWDSLKSVPFSGDKKSSLSNELAQEQAAPFESSPKIDPLDDTTLRRMSEYHDISNLQQHHFFENMQKQERLEREFNSALTHIEDLQEAADIGDPRVGLEKTNFSGKEISIFHLKGMPLKAMTHMLNYRENSKTIGGSTSERLVADPSFWYEPFERPQSDAVNEGWDVRDEARSNELSTGFIDVDENLNSFDTLPVVSSAQNKYNRIIYPFDHVRPNSVLYAKRKDGAIPNIINERDWRSAIAPLSYSVDHISELNEDVKNRAPDDHSYVGYVEVAQLRYDEKGEPLKPAYMLTDMVDVARDTEGEPERNDEGDDYSRAHYLNAIKRHAAYNDIPIVVLDRDYYPKYVDDYARNLDKLIAVQSPGELVARMNDQLPPGACADAMKQFLDVSNQSAWDFIVQPGAAEKLRALAKEIADPSASEALEDFFLMTGAA